MEQQDSCGAALNSALDAGIASLTLEEDILKSKRPSASTVNLEDDDDEADSTRNPVRDTQQKLTQFSG